MVDIQVLKNPALIRLFAAQLLSQICDKLMLVAWIWWLTDHSAGSITPLFIAAGALPHLLLAGASPGWIARLGGPLRTVISTDIARGLILILAALFWDLIESSGALPITLIALSFLINLAGALFNPAILSLPVRVLHLEEQGTLLQKGTALLESCFSLAAILGPLLSTFALSGLGQKGLLILNGISYWVAAGIETGIQEITVQVPFEKTQPTSAKKILQSDSTLATLLLIFLAMNFFLGPLMVFLPLFSKLVYQGTLGTLAWLEGALGLGTFLGALALSLIRTSKISATQPHSSPVTRALAAVALFYLIFSLSRHPWLGVLAIGGLGFFLSLANIHLLQFFQLRPAPQDVPAVMSLINLISVASLPLSMGAVSLILKSNPADIRLLAPVCASLVLGLVILMAAKPNLRKLDFNSNSIMTESSL